MPTFYLETKSDLSDRLIGPIDSATGWPKPHPSLVVDAPDFGAAIQYFRTKYPGDVLAVYSIEEPNYG